MTLPLLLFLAADPATWIVEAGGVASGGVVDLRNSWVTDSDMPQLVQMPGLTSLDLSGTRISDRGLRALRTARDITSLNLAFAELITDEGTSALRGWKKLRRLSLRGTRITDNTLEAVSMIPTLEALDVGYAQLTDAGLDHLTSLTGLREISLGGNKLTDAGLQFLRRMPQVTLLDVSGSQRTDSGLWSLLLGELGIDAIAAVPALRELYLGGTAVGVSGLRQLAALPALERLSLQGCLRIGRESVGVLTTMKGLRRLDVAGTALTAEDVASLRAALPRCEVVWSPSAP